MDGAPLVTTPMRENQRANHTPANGSSAILFQSPRLVPPSLSSPWPNKRYALRNRAEKIGANLYSRNPRPRAARRTTAVCSRSLRRGLVLHTFCEPAAAWTPFGIVFGWAGISRSGS